MDEPSKIEELILESHCGSPAGFREELLITIQKSSHQQTRRDDIRTLIGGLVLLAVISLIFLGTLTLHHSMLVQTILSSN